jgi:hypothetical protein
LYNRGTTPANLGGWKLTKGVDYTFSGGTLNPGQYLVVAADVGRFQAKYPGLSNVVGGWMGRLANSQEEIQIEDAGGAVADSVTYADQGDWADRRRGPLDNEHEGWDWVQPASGGGSSLELINPALTNNEGQNWHASTVAQGTPGAANSVASSNIAPMILDVSHFPLVPKSTDPVTITAKLVDEAGAAQSATVFWRLDGEPSFTPATMVDNGTNGDALAGDGVWTAVLPAQQDKTIVEFYVRAQDSTGNARTWPAPTDDAGTQGANALYQVDDTAYSGRQPIYRLIMTEAERAELSLIGSRNPDAQSNAKMNATFIAIDSVGQQLRYLTGVRNRGHGSRLGRPNNYHVVIPSDDPWKGRTAINFNARDVFNQVMGSAIWRMAGFAASDTVPIQVRVNGENAVASNGQYALVEEADSAFAKNHFPQDSNGNSYGAFRLDPALVPEAELQWLGTDPESYRGLYPKQTNSEVDDYSDLIHLLDVLNNTPDDRLVGEASKVLNLDEWLHYFALDNLMLNRETGLVRGIGDDFNLYRGEKDTRFILVPHDLDTIMGTGLGGVGINQSIFAIIEGVPGETGATNQNGVEGLKRLLLRPEVAPLYYKAYLDMIQRVFNPTVLYPLIDQTIGDFASPTQIQNAKNFVTARATAVLNQINRQLTAESPMPVVDGYRQTNQPATSVTGRADVTLTRSVLVNGVPADYNPRTGVWELNTTGTGGGTSTAAIFPAGSDWRYLADGTDQGTAWRSPSFVDSGWGTGRAQFGYGDGDEITPLPNTTRVTTYFRKTFNIADTSQFIGFRVRLLRDDGAVVYVNGNRVINSNMPTNAVNFTTQPLGNQSAPAENTFFEYLVDASLLNNGSNVIAVEIHNLTSSNPPSQDLSFDLGFDGVLPGTGGTVSGGVPLHPGVNRVTVQAFDGLNGTGKEVGRAFLDVWNTATNNGSFARPAATPADIDDLALVVPDSYRPGVPFLVQVQALKSGQMQRDLWDGVVSLQSNRPDINLSTNQIVLRNGWGSVLVTPTGAGTAAGSFMLSASIGNETTTRNLTSLAGAAMSNVSGTLPGASTTWNGIVHVTGNVIVPVGHTLTIQPGTLVLVDGVASGTAGAVIEIDGKIQSLGTAADPVTMTAFDPARNWGGLRFASAQPSLFQYTFISEAGNTTGLGHTNTGPAIRASNSNITFDHSAITDNSGKAGDVSGGSLTFLFSEMSRSRMGFEIAGTPLMFDHSYVFDMRGPDDADGIYLHGAPQSITLQHGMIGALDDDDVDTLNAVVTIDDMILRDAHDKGVSVLDGVVTIKNSLIAGNSLQSEDATFSSVSAKISGNGGVVTVNIDHTTIVGNDPGGQGRDVGIESRNKNGVTSGTVNYNVTNSIISATKPVSVEAPHVPATVLISYSNTFGTNWAGTGNVNANPQFVDPANHNYRLKPGSPSIDTGDPAAANNDPDGTRGDQGVYRNGLAGTRPGRTIAGGTLSGVTILSPEDGPYMIAGDVIIPTGATLYVLPGTSVFFQQDTGITINGGRIVAEGTPYEQIRFTRVPGTAATWDGIQIQNSNLDNRLSYAVLEWGVAGVTNNGMLGVSSARATVDHVYFDKTDRRRLRFNNAWLVVRNSEFADIFPGDLAPTTDNFSEDVWGSGIMPGGQVLFENNVFGTTKGHNDILDIDTAGAFGPTFIIRNNVFKGGGDDALDLEGDAYVEGNVFSNFIKDVYNTGTGNSNIISAGLGHTYTMVRNVILNTQHAVQVKEDSFLYFINNTMIGGPTNTAAIYFFRPQQANSWGKGAYIDGSIFREKPIILADYTNTTQITLNRSIVPANYLSWGTGNTSEDPRLRDPANGDYSLRPGSPAIGTGPNGLDMGALVPAGASISGEPASVVGTRSAALTVGGPAITHYKYRLNNGAWSAETPVATPISLSGLADGTYTVYVIGKNDAGEWQAESAPTASRTWTVDNSKPTIRVNEVLSNGATGVADMIELYNHGDAPVDLLGMSITDATASPRKYVFNTSTIVQPGQYLVLIADSKSGDGKIHVGFSLKSDGEGVYLYDTTSAGGGQIDGVTFGPQLEGYSIGRARDGSWALNQPTFGSANVVQRTGDPGTLKINEWQAAGIDPFKDDFIEIYNPDPLPVGLGGFYLSDRPIPQPDKSPILPLTFIKGASGGAGGYAAFVADGDPENGGYHTNFSLPHEQGMIGLFDPNQTKIDWVLYLTQHLGESQGRTPDGGNTYTFYTQPNPGLPNPGVGTSTLPLRITEINFNPPTGSGPYTSPEFEFIELKNTGATSINLSGVKLTGAANFTFGNVSLGAGQYVVIVRNPTAFAKRYGTGINIGGTFNDPLNDTGGQIRLLDAAGDTILDFGYSDAWQPTSDGDGDTLVFIDPAADPATWGQAASWRASRSPLGTPGIDESAVPASPNVVINEILAHTAGNASDWIELRNTTGSAIDISGWYLSNDAADILKYRLPTGTTIPANDYLVLNQSALGFALNGDSGEVYLSASSSPGVLTAYRQGVTFGASDVGVSLGRHTTSTGAVDFTALSSATPGAANAYPKVGPIVITEIQYHPGGSASEFVELHNTGSQPVDLSNWKFTNGIDFTFPAGTVLAPGAYLLVVPINPADYRSTHDIPASVMIVGPYQDNLSNAGETLELSRPGTSETGAATTPYVVADRVTYGTRAPWPSSPDGAGPSLARTGQSLYANDPSSWTADSGTAIGSPGQGTSTAPPTVAGSPFYVEGNRVRFVFGKDVSASLGASDLVLQNLATGQTITGLTLGYDPASNTATWTSATPLPDGNYTATLSAAGITDNALRALDGNGDGTGGDDYVVSLFKFAGDANRDRTVDFTDLVKLAQNYNSTAGGKTWGDADFTGDGNVDFADLVALAQNYNTSLPLPGAAPAPATTPAVTAEQLAASMGLPTPKPAKPSPKPTPKPAPPAAKPVAPSRPAPRKKVFGTKLVSGVF